MDLTWAAIEAANSTLARWRNKIAQWKKSEMTSDEEFLRIIENDLDTPNVIQYLRAIEKNENNLDRAAIFLFADKVLGLNLDKQAAEKTLSQSQSDLLQQRGLARNEKRWSDSDELRKQLEASGLSISDTSDGQKWSWN
jgi:cysteinyl-tRNA synthetase